jgi:hypothetical protein
VHAYTTTFEWASLIFLISALITGLILRRKAPGVTPIVVDIVPDSVLFDGDRPAVRIPAVALETTPI